MVDMKIDQAEIGKRIKEIRGELTLDEFGDIVGISRSMISKYENGDAWLKPGILSKILEHGGKTADWLFWGAEPECKQEPQPITYQLSQREQKALNTLQEQIELYGLEKRFQVIEVHHPPPSPKTTIPEIQELVEIMTALDPEHRSDILKYAKEKRIVHEALIQKEATRHIQNAAYEELKEAERIRQDLASGEQLAGEQKEQPPAGKSHQVNGSSGSLKRASR